MEKYRQRERKDGWAMPPEKPTEGTTDRFQVYLSGREKFNDPSNVIADQAGLQILTLRNYQPHIASFLPHFTAKRRTPTICHRNIVVDIRLEIFFSSADRDCECRMLSSRVVKDRYWFAKHQTSLLQTNAALQSVHTSVYMEPGRP